MHGHEVVAASGGRTYASAANPCEGSAGTGAEAAPQAPYTAGLDQTMALGGSGNRKPPPQGHLLGANPSQNRFGSFQDELGDSEETTKDDRRTSVDPPLYSNAARWRFTERGALLGQLIGVEVGLPRQRRHPLSNGLVLAK